MRRSLPALLVFSLTLAGCGTVADSRLNPVNWFGAAPAAPLANPDASNPLIPSRSGIFASRRAAQEAYFGQPFEQITALSVEPAPDGVIVRATGLAGRQGIYAVQLTPANPDEAAIDGVLTYRLEGMRPDRNTGVGSAPTREVTAARHVSEQTLRGVHTIRVEGAQNAQVARR
ncbi:hypothetical protein ACFSUD_15955 [Sulfitobacter aestuarii]|uniref:Lipoprotein n=1 Tax=Sulfitobacter aestuarii TaxID=2161676 RepID=A0ABW5U5B0_9RHOB